jgi:pimeloyl-ACP methyl ester carboxylesterase
MTTLTEPITRTLDVPGATLTYDVRPGTGDDVPLMLIGQPMGAAGFGTLSGHFPDRTMVTFDPRGVERSVKTDPDSAVTPDIQADDVHAIIEAVGLGPVDVFGSSGGAVTGLALVAKHPDDVRTLVAHEPPLASLLPDREFALAAAAAVRESYLQRGFGAGMAHFIAVVSHSGPFTAEVAGQPGPDPAMFGMPTEDDGTRDDAMLNEGLKNVPSRARWRTAAPTRSPIASAPRSWPSPGVTAGSSVASTARWASRTRSRLGSARCSRRRPSERLQPLGGFWFGSRRPSRSRSRAAVARRVRVSGRFASATQSAYAFWWLNESRS